MGTIYARGKWLWLGFIAPDGKRYMRSARLKVGQEDEARKMLAELEATVATRTPTAPAPLTHTVASWAAAWSQRRIDKDKWTNAKLDQKALEQHVAQALVEVHGKPLAFGRLRLEEVRLVHLRAWLEAMELKKLAARTVNSVYNLMSRLFRDAVRNELIQVSPCQLERGELPALIDKDITWRDTAVFSAREVETLLSSADVPLDRRVTYALGFLSRLREGEIAALRVEHYDSATEPLGALLVQGSYTRRNGKVKSPKNKLPRKVPVHPVLAALLGRWLLSGWSELHGRAPKPGDLLMPNRAGGFINDNTVLRGLQRDLEALGLRHRRFHDTGRTFVSLARDGGAVKDLLRWVSHGPTKKEMVDAYSTPAWSTLCQQVLCVKVQLRGTAEVLPLRATGTGPLQSAATLGHDSEGTARPDSKKPLCPGRDSNSPRRASTGAEEQSACEVAETSGVIEGRLNTADRSAGATISTGADELAALFSEGE